MYYGYLVVENIFIGTVKKIISKVQLKKVFLTIKFVMSIVRLIWNSIKEKTFVF